MLSGFDRTATLPLFHDVPKFTLSPDKILPSPKSQTNFVIRLTLLGLVVKSVNLVLSLLHIDEALKEGIGTAPTRTLIVVVSEQPKDVVT